MGSCVVAGPVWDPTMKRQICSFITSVPSQHHSSSLQVPPSLESQIKAAPSPFQLSWISLEIFFLLPSFVKCVPDWNTPGSSSFITFLFCIFCLIFPTSNPHLKPPCERQGGAEDQQILSPDLNLTAPPSGHVVLGNSPWKLALLSLETPGSPILPKDYLRIKWNTTCAIVL